MPWLQQDKNMTTDIPIHDVVLAVVGMMLNTERQQVQYNWQSLTSHIVVYTPHNSILALESAF